MKKITLVRHAKVAIDNTHKIDSSSLQEWIQEYDLADIDPDSKPSSRLIEQAQQADITLTSQLKRSIESAKLLNITPQQSSQLFNEALIPKVSIPFLRLKPKSWLVLLRVLLLLGLGKKDNSLNASKKRANRAVEELLELSQKRDNILLVGHGGMNFLIKKRLLKEGWKLQEKASNRHWGTTILTLQNYS